MSRPTEPTGDQCNKRLKVYEDEYRVGYAIWYPQMGGYVGKAVAVMDKEWIEHDGGSEGGCIDVYVWHDGEFPFNEDDERQPAHIHHCDPEQFIEFGTALKELNDKNRRTE